MRGSSQAGSLSEMPNKSREIYMKSPMLVYLVSLWHRMSQHLSLCMTLGSCAQMHDNNATFPSTNVSFWLAGNVIVTDESIDLSLEHHNVQAAGR